MKLKLRRFVLAAVVLAAVVVAVMWALFNVFVVTTAVSPR